MGSLILLPMKAVAWSWHVQPWPLRRAWARGVGLVLRALRFREKVIEQNLQIAFPGAENAARRQELKRSAYTHLGFLVLEVLLLLGPMKQAVKKRGVLKGFENWQRAQEQGKGAIFLASHVGNWEIMSAVGAQAGIDLLLVTKQLKPAWLHEAIESGRKRVGVSGTYEPKTFRDVLKHLKEKKTVGIVLDQYTGPPVGVRVPVFGVPVGTHTVLATLAKRTAAPVLPVVNYRDHSGRQIVEIFPAVDWKADDDANREIALNTANYSAILEKHILAHPEQWLWTHKRFKGDLSPLKAGEWSEGRRKG